MASVMGPRSASRHDDVDLERDRALVERCQAGDQRAFEDLYLRYRERLYRFCLRRTKSASEAEDLVQETFARAWKALPRFEGERRFYPWLSVIANNLCTDLARRGGRCTPVDESDLDLMAPAQVSEQEQLVDVAGDGQILAAALGRLSPRHREVLELREGRNWSYQQIAAHSGVEVSTIETLLFRARRSLRREFLTIARAETGLAGLLALPFAALRRGLRRLKELAAHAPGVAKLGALTSGTSGPTIAGGAVVVITAAAITAGALVGAHPGGTTAPRLSPAAVALVGQGDTARAGATNSGTKSQVVDGGRTSAGTESSAGHTKSAASGPTGTVGSTSGQPASSLGAGDASGAVQQAVSGATATVTKTVEGTNETVTKTVKTVSKTATTVKKKVTNTVTTTTKVLKKLLGGLGSSPVSSILGGTAP